MDLAWTTFVFIVLLLPAVLFFVGLSVQERAPREVIRASAVGELGVAVIVAIIIHFATIIVLHHLFQFRLYFFILPLVSQTYSVEQYLRYAIDSAKHVGIYMLISGFAGLIFGWIGSQLLSRGYIPFLATHRWAYDLIGGLGGGVITANVMTNVIHEHRILMYKRRLREFFLDSNGRVSYLVLTDCSRFYMYMEDDAPKPGKQLDLFREEAGRAERRIWNYLAIDSSQIANVLFDKSPEIAVTEEAESELLREMQELIDSIKKDIEI